MAAASRDAGRPDRMAQSQLADKCDRSKRTFDSEAACLDSFRGIET